MKKMIFALMVMLTTTLSASAMSYEQARNEALFLTDKMAYELNLTDAQYEAAYEINLDYLMGVTSYNDVYGPYWERRNLDMSYILYQWQWDAFMAATYFYRPLYWSAGHWHFGIYARYTVRDYFYFGRPHFYATYRGGHAWHMNGGRSYYHGRIDHFRPALRDNRQHFGMRSKWDRGDFRNSRSSYRGNSSTRVTAGRNGHDNGSFGNRGRSMGGDNGSFGNRGRSMGSETRPQDNGAPTNRNFGNGSRTATQTPATPSRPQTTTTPSTPTRNFGGSSTNRPQTTTTPSRPTTTTTPSRPTTGTIGSATRSIGGRSNNSFGNRSTISGSRSSSSNMSRSSSSSNVGRSSSSSNVGRSSSSSHGHFGGRR